MKFEKLGNIVTITSGGTPLTSINEYYSNGTIPWVKTGDLKVRHLTNVPDKITQLGLENSSAKLFPINTVLVAMYGATIGACSILKTEAATNQACAALLPNEEINHEFLYFYLIAIKDELIRKGVGGGQPNISATILKSVNIPLFSLTDQHRIATILSKAEALIAQRKQSITLLDDYLKSTFLDMFGDPVRGNKFERKPFKAICTVRQGLQIPISERKIQSGENRYPYITNQFINGGKIGEFIENPKPNVICTADDILMTRTGNTGIVLTDVEGVFHNNFFLIDYDRKQINKKYLVSFLQLPQVKKIVLQKASTTTIPDLNHGDFYKITLPVPPLPLQNQFAAIVQKVELLKKHYQQSLVQLQGLFGSLSQRGFKGELNLSKMVLEYDEEYSTTDNDRTAPKPINWDNVSVKLPDVSKMSIDNYYKIPEIIRAEHGNIETPVFNWEYFFKTHFINTAITTALVQDLYATYSYEKENNFDYEEYAAIIFKELRKGNGYLKQQFNKRTKKIELVLNEITTT